MDDLQAAFIAAASAEIYSERELRDVTKDYFKILKDLRKEMGMSTAPMKPPKPRDEGYGPREVSR